MPSSRTKTCRSAALVLMAATQGAQAFSVATKSTTMMTTRRVLDGMALHVASSHPTARGSNRRNNESSSPQPRNFINVHDDEDEEDEDEDEDELLAGYDASSSAESLADLDIADDEDEDEDQPAFTRQVGEAATTDRLDTKVGSMDSTNDLELAAVDTMTIKDRLLDLLPRMTGTEAEFRAVEAYVNTLEDRYAPVQTLDFLNLAMSGEWQLLFSTNLAAGPKPNFRLRELVQCIQADRKEGKVTNTATWDLAETTSGDFASTGTFSAKCSYSINQGARMVLNLDDHVLEPARGSKIPKDIQGLVGLLFRAMPKEMFDPNDHAMDTTYLDGDLRIVRMTGPRFEGVRDIFIRRGSMELDPTSKDD